jgi:hypothetical protein
MTMKHDQLLSPLLQGIQTILAHIYTTLFLAGPYPGDTCLDSYIWRDLDCQARRVCHQHPTRALLWLLQMEA